ncbi:ETC complex I subunit conserved region-domain-containing protein [Geopyxis carbonaria]|nr:ETC complex I subunit conserved region-domain-containing protein [Geopyxis carbonaria]
MSLSRTTRLLLTSRLYTVGPSTFVRQKTTSTTTTNNESTIAPRRSAALTPTQEPSGMTNAATSLAGPPSEAPVDHGTSCYSPIPSFPEDRGPNEPIAASIISGAPMDLQSRTVRIYKPTKPATQSGNWNGRQWRMDWDVLPRGHRWENPLMGWQSSGDFMQGTHIFFKSKEDAIHFAEKQGYDWFVQEPNERAFRSKSYSANFLHSPKKLKMIRTK